MFLQVMHFTCSISILNNFSFVQRFVFVWRNLVVVDLVHYGAFFLSGNYGVKIIETEILREIENLFNYDNLP